MMKEYPEVPDHIQKLADKLGVNVQAIPMNQITDILAALTTDLLEEKEKNRVAKQACMALLLKLAGHATITGEEAAAVVRDFTLEYRTDSASDSVYMYLKPKK